VSLSQLVVIDHHSPDNIVLDYDGLCINQEGGHKKVIIKGFYFENNKTPTRPNVYSCIPQFNSDFFDIEFKQYTGGNTRHTLEFKDEDGELKDIKKIDTTWNSDVFFLFIPKEDSSLLSKLNEASKKLGNLHFLTRISEKSSQLNAYKIDGVKTANQFCYMLEQLILFIQKHRLNKSKSDKPKSDKPKSDKSFSLQIINTSSLNSKYKVPSSSDFSSNYSNVKFFEIGTDVHFNWSPGGNQHFTLTPGFGYRNSTQGITNKIDDGDYPIELSDEFINSKKVYLNNIEEHITYNLHSLNISVGGQYTFDNDILSISAQVFGRHYIPGAVKSEFTRGTFSYRATSNNIQGELINIPELGLLESVDATTYAPQTNRIKGFGIGANVDLKVNINKVFIFGGLSFIRNSFSVEASDVNTKLTSELNDYKSTISISEGFKNNILGLNLGFGYKFK